MIRKQTSFIILMIINHKQKLKKRSFNARKSIFTQQENTNKRITSSEIEITK